SVGPRRVKPGSIVVTIGLDDKGVPFPMPDAPSHPPGLGRFGRELPAVGPDGAPRMTDFEELNHTVRQHYEFETVVVGVVARISVRIAVDETSTFTGRVFAMKRRSIRTLLTNRGFEPFLAKRSKGRRIPERVRDSVKPPYTREVMRVECMTFD